MAAKYTKKIEAPELKRKSPAWCPGFKPILLIFLCDLCVLCGEMFFPGSSAARTAVPGRAIGSFLRRLPCPHHKTPRPGRDTLP
jgi:hypothetical protein